MDDKAWAVEHGREPSACHQYVISLQSAYNQHVISKHEDDAAEGAAEHRHTGHQHVISMHSPSRMTRQREPQNIDIKAAYGAHFFQ